MKEHTMFEDVSTKALKRYLRNVVEIADLSPQFEGTWGAIITEIVRELAKRDELLGDK